MNCLICGHKLAIFRKLSLGDFCCEEHRALFLKEQKDRGLSRLMESSGEVKVRVALLVRRDFAGDYYQAGCGQGFAGYAAGRVFHQAGV